MNYLEDILARAQQGQAIDNLARTYGISPEEAQQAIAATLPAFEVGLQRSTASPQSFAELLGAMTRNPYGQAFDDPSADLGAVHGQGNDALAAMFGSPDVSRAVAAQAASTTGLSSDLLKRMLPAIAALVLGGMMKGGAGGGGGGLGDLLGSILGGGAGAGTQVPQQRPSGSGNPLDDLLGSILGGGAGAGTGLPQQRPSGSGNPLDDLLGGILGGGAPQQRAGQDREDGSDPFGTGRPPSPDPRQAPGGGDPLQEILGGILGGMFGGGRAGPAQGGGIGGGSAGDGTTQDPRLQPFHDIFDQFTRR